MRRTAAASVSAAALSLAAVTVSGLLRLHWSDVVGADPGPMLRLASLLAGGAAVVAGARLLTGWSVWACALAAAAAIVVLSGHAGAGAAVVFFVVSSGLLGAWVVRALGGASSAPPRPVEACLAGTGLYGTLIGFAASRPVHEVWVYVLALAVPLLAGSARVRRALAAWPRPQRLQGPRSFGGLLIDAVSAGLFLVYVAVALLPEIGADALAMHLFVPAQLAQRHVWAFDAGKYVWAVMPMLADWMFAAAYMLGGETAARLLNVALLGGVAVLARELVRWCGGGARARRWAVLVLLSTPLTFAVGSSLFIEIAWTAFVLAGLLALLRAGEPEAGGSGQLAVAGLFLGLALAAKAVTLTLVPVFLAVLAMRPRVWRSREGAFGLLGGVVLLVALGLFPYANAWWRTRNPVFPFFNGLFRSPLYPPENFESASVFSKGLHWDFPYQAVFQPARFIEGLTGAGGFQWLLLLVPAVLALLFGRERRPLALLAAALAMVWIAFQSVAYLRYVFPAFVIAGAALAVAMESEAAAAPGRVVLAGAALAAVLLNLVFFGAASPYRDIPVAAVLDDTRRVDWLELRQPVRRAVTLVNDVNTGKAPVAVLAQPALGHLATDALIPSWYNFRFDRQLRAQQDGPAMARFLQDAGVEYVVLDADWAPAGPRQQVEAVTEPVASFARVSVRRWKPEYRFQQELLADATFGPGAGWQVADGAVRTAGGIAVTQAATATQSVPVQAGRAYLNVIRIACPQPAQARAQVNWQDGKGAFIKADIRVVDCGPQPSEHRMEVVAPAGAAVATVYASAHGPGRVEFLENSFRR